MSTTNVRPKELNYHGYSSAEYDDGIARAIPYHKELHGKIAEVVCNVDPLRAYAILELGVGTGITTRLVRALFPNARITAVDFCDTMLAGARKKLGEVNIRYILGDYSELLFDSESYKFVVSVIGIHHQTTEGKKALFGKIHTALRHGGKFIFGDLVTYRDPKVAALNQARHFHFLVEHAKDEATLTEWAHHHMFLNDLAPMEDQIEWLEHVGFSVSMEFQKFNTALLVCVKR